MLGYIPLPDELVSLIQSGGSVLWVIFIVTFLLWMLMIERIIYLWRTFPGELKMSNSSIKEVPSEEMWHYSAAKRAIMSESTQRIFKNMTLISGLINIFPLLGLLGTVTGMIHLFDVLAFVGNTNAKAIASGVSMAVIPTVAGMFLAIVGIAFRAFLLHRAKTQVFLLENQLR